MRKKILLGLFVIVFYIYFLSAFLINNYREANLVNRSLSLISSYSEKLHESVSRYDVGLTGTIDVKANYKGAHGENYPAQYNYNFEVSDKLYFEDTSLSYFDINTEWLKVFSVLGRLKNLDLKKYLDITTEKNDIVVSYDAKYINDILGSEFENTYVKIHTRGITRKFDKIVITLDEIVVTINNKEIIANSDGNEVRIVPNDAGFFIAINNVLRGNIFVNDDNCSGSLVIGDRVYYFEVSEDNAIVKFSNEASIYNSIEMNVHFSKLELTKMSVAANFDDNPIIRYLSEARYSLWNPKE